MPRLTILGVQLEADGYPNVLHRVRGLEGEQRLRVRKIHRGAWRETSQSERGRSRLLRNAWRMLYAHLEVTLRFLLAAQPDTVYIPYPATFMR